MSSIQGWGFEPSLRLAPNGTIYTASPNTLSSGTSWVWRSVDGGKTFKWIPAAAPQQGKLPTCAGGGDIELAVDSANRLYTNDLTLANFSTARSDDGGRTFTPPNCTAVPGALVDRQWYATDGDAVNGGNLYLTYNRVAQSGPVCPGRVNPGSNVLVLARSPLPGVGGTAGVHFAPTKDITAPCDEHIPGNVEVSPATHRIFIPHHNDATDQMRMARCETVPFTADPTGLSCVDLLVATFPGFKAAALFPTMAIDRDGNLFVVWEMAPIDQNGNVTGDTLLYWSSSTDEGDTWTPPVQIPTPGLLNNVLAWPVAGDAGRVDVAWFGTSAPQNPLDPDCGHGSAAGGPDSAVGDWSLYMTQTLNGTDPTPTFTPPVLASEHHVHRGRVTSFIGDRCGDGDRIAVGDFFQMRMGPQGEALIAFSDANNRRSTISPKNMFVRQNGGTGLLASAPLVKGEPAPLNSVADPAGDARLEAAGQIGPTQPNLDIKSSSVVKPNPTTYRVTMSIENLSSLAPNPASGNPDPVLVWLTQWIAPSRTDPNGGKNFFVYAESSNGGAPRCFSGESAVTFNGGGVAFTYPGRTQITGPACSVDRAAGTVVIEVPTSQVRVEDPIDEILYSVTASTMTLSGPADDSVGASTGIGGRFFNLIDVAPAYDFDPNPVAGSLCPGLARVPGNHVVGTAGNDVLKGTRGRDALCGLGGRDRIRGGRGVDIAVGGSGKDRISTGKSRDRLRGGGGHDRLNGGRARDLLQGGGGRDRLNGGRARDLLRGGGGRDRCRGGPARDRFRRCERRVA